MTLGDRIVVMKDGRIQQADTPLNTYSYPANRFVAGFIGMPPMNFFDGAIKMADGKMIFEESNPASKATNGFRIQVPEHLREAMAGKVGQPVVAGIRPEHFHLDASMMVAEGAPIDVKLNVIEPLGNEMDLYMSTDQHDYLVGRVEAQSGLEMGSRATVYVDLRKIHFFEPGETGMNLGLARESAHAVA
jgi:multiple sugar transport system ATP-binding protein